jgi:hypothetical protein
MFEFGISMNPHELVKTWLLWHQAVEFLKHDIPLMESSDTRFPIVYCGFLRLLGKEAFAKEQGAAKELRRAGIRILGEKWNRGEYFLMWQYREETQIVRMLDGKLRFEVQKKVDEMIHIKLHQKISKFNRN